MKIARHPAPPAPLSTHERLRGALSHLADALRLLSFGDAPDAPAMARMVCADLRRIRDVVSDMAIEYGPKRRGR